MMLLQVIKEYTYQMTKAMLKKNNKKAHYSGQVDKNLKLVAPSGYEFKSQMIFRRVNLELRRRSDIAADEEINP